MQRLNHNTMLQALEALGRKLNISHRVEILIVGGAAGVLTNLLPSVWTTADVDAIDFRLPADRDAVLEAAAAVGRELLLPANWMNDLGGLFAWTLPGGWENRRVLVGEFGSLAVYAVGRFDLIVMKFVAHRPSDLEHLERIGVTHMDLEAVKKCLDLMAFRFCDEIDSEKGRQIAMAQAYVNGWNAST